MSAYQDGWNEAIAVSLRLLEHSHNAHNARDRIAELATYFPSSEQRRKAAWKDPKQWVPWPACD